MAKSKSKSRREDKQKERELKGEEEKLRLSKKYGRKRRKRKGKKWEGMYGSQIGGGRGRKRWLKMRKSKEMHEIETLGCGSPRRLRKRRKSKRSRKG